MSKNNESRDFFNRFVEANQFTREPRRNVFTQQNGTKYSFSITSKGKFPQCRQVYEDTVGFVTLDETTGKFLKFDFPDQNQFAVSRISPSGLKAYSMTFSSARGIECNMINPDAKKQDQE